MEIKGKRALVTGASSGIGLEFARQLHALGARVTAVARREERLDELCRGLCSERANSADYLVADLTKADDAEQIGGITRVVDYASEHQIDILVNNAGTGSCGYFHEQDIDNEIEMVALNVAAPLRLTHAVIPQMKERGSGAIVNIASIAGIQPLPFMATYTATKAAVLTHALALRQELSKYGITVLAVCPGPVETEFAELAHVPPGASRGLQDALQAVVRDSIAALRRNRSRAFPGWRAKLLALPCLWLPQAVTTWVVAKSMQAEIRKQYQIAEQG